MGNKPWNNAGAGAPANVEKAANPPAGATAPATPQQPVNPPPSQAGAVDAAEAARLEAERKAKEAADAAIAAQAAADAAAQEAAAKEGSVIVDSPRELKIMLEHGQAPFVVQKGVSRVPQHILEHWYAKANGVKKFTG